MISQHHAKVPKFKFLITRRDMRLKQPLCHRFLEFRYVDKPLSRPQSQIFASLPRSIRQSRPAFERPMVVNRTNPVPEQRTGNAPGTVFQTVRLPFVQPVSNLLQPIPHPLSNLLFLHLAQ